jgi:hypothetical protein
MINLLGNERGAMARGLVGDPLAPRKQGLEPTQRVFGKLDRVGQWRESMQSFVELRLVRLERTSEGRMDPRRRR